ncbi:MAG: sugar phosphate nucleotidyltransferase [bacterium]|nr:sugar phosphate nucleotidyltransferase [bacterium]
MSDRSAVIMAAGKGTRLEPLSKTVPKPLLKVAGKTILYHNMHAMSHLVNEYILIVEYMHELIESAVGGTFEGKPVYYVRQHEPLGTGHALKIAEDSIHNENFFVINGDDIYDQIFYEESVKYDRSIAGKSVENWPIFGILRTKADGTLDDVVEKPSEFIGDVANIGLYYLDKNIFKYTKNMPLSKRGEYELTDPLTAYCKDYAMELVTVNGYWLTIGYPWHILTANERLMPDFKGEILGEIEPNVVIKGNVSIGKGTVVKSGTYLDGNIIIGENCIIGPHCYIRGNVDIGNYCKIGSSVEIEHTSIGNKVNIEHLSFIGFSVLGNNIILGGGTVTADRRHDRGSIKVNVKENLVDTGLYHLGAIIGDQVRTGIHTSIYPGRKLAYHSYTSPGEVVKQDKLSSQDITLK